MADPQQHAEQSTLWKVRERPIDDTRRARVSIATVELPDGMHFEQWVMRIQRAAMVLVLSDRDEVLMLRRHRFIIDRWVWELPGGYVAEGEDAAQVAAREVEEETGWRPQALEHMIAFQPLVGSVDSRNDLFLARGAEKVHTAPDINEAEAVAWIPLDEALALTRRGEIVGSGTIIGLLHVLAMRGRG